VYNGAAFVEQAVRSILEQTFDDWELVMVDDGSRDDSRQICESVARGHSRVRVYANDHNLGLARTMNRLVASSTGKYIAVQEQDDFSEPCRLALEVAALDARPEVGLVSGVAAWLDDEGKVFNHFPGFLHRGGQYPQDHAQMVRFLYTEQCKVVNAACMFRRTLADQIPGPFDPEARMSIDWQFFLHAAHLQRVYGIPHVLVRMRRGRGRHSLTGDKDLQFREGRRCIQKIHAQYRDRRDSPVKRSYRQAVATQLVLEARTRGGLRGLALLGLAFLYWPPHAGAKQTLRDFCHSARRKIIGPPKTAPCAES
jgi:glycosyltransferase involved in cell wall biosynthesis